MVTVTAAKRIRALLQNQPERQKKQEARVELRKRIRDHGLALTQRMDHERTLNMRADTPLTARVASDIGAPPRPPPRPPRARPRPPGSSGSGNPMSMGSMAPMSTGSAVGSAGRAAARVATVHHIGTPRSVASTPPAALRAPRP